MTLLPADSVHFNSLSPNGKGKRARRKCIKTAIPPLIYRTAFLSCLILCLAACGKKNVPMVWPGPPSATVQGNEIPPETPAPPAASETETVIPSPADILSETSAPPAQRLESAEGNSLGPVIRIGLIRDAEKVRISARGDYYLLENKPEATRTRVRGDVHVQVETKGAAGSGTAFFRIQVASLRNRDAAEALRKSLSEKFKTPAVINDNGADSNRVRLGEFSTREKAQEFCDTLKAGEYPDAYVVEETRPVRSGGPTLALRGPDKLFLLNPSGFLFFPSSSDNYLSVDGKPYRGLLDIRLAGDRITVINQLRVEEYLPGVVPAELSPSRYPEFAALAAQSIAARTYALKHLGQYRSQGFDLTDDTNTQVYKGVAAEADASTEAVRRTAGLAIYYDGKLIDAMYMSTCGGRTEDFSAVYDAADVPYLRSVVCAIEDGSGDAGTTLASSHSLQAPIQADDGSGANRNLELARILGIVDTGSDFSADYLAGTVTNAEAVDWLKNALKVLQKPQKVSSSSGLDTRIGFLEHAAESIFGSDEIRRKISAPDADYYVGSLEDGTAVEESARADLAYLMQKSLWRPFADNTVRPNDKIRRSEAIFLLLGWVESLKPDILRQGVFTGETGGGADGTSAPEIEIQWRSNTKKFRLSDALPVFRIEQEQRIPVRSIRLVGNEKIFFHLGPKDTVDFLEVEFNPTGTASDRYSPSATWEVVLKRSEVAEKLKRLTGNIGELEDIKPARVGKSGRAVQIQAIGSRSSVVLNGYKVRGALELRDTLFTITRKFNPDGGIAEFTFHGRGYGHGIGLCQTGAYGMAKAGKDYTEILKTYYRGVEIKKAY